MALFLIFCCWMKSANGRLAPWTAMIAALETSRGKIEGSKMLWIGTRPPAESHPFALALAGGVGYAQVHAARPDDPPA